MAKKKVPAYSNDEIRNLMLRYFYERNQSATSVRGKRGSAATIRVVREELKRRHGLTAQQVTGNLRYLISHGWVEEMEVKKEVRLKTGMVVPSITKYYAITAAGIDKIEGPGEFTRDPFHSIRIEATGQNIITVGDGNRINAVFKDIGQALSDLTEQVRRCEQLKEREKLEYIADIQTIQAQLAKPEPNKTVLRSIWAGLEKLSTLEGVAGAFQRAASLVIPLLGGGG